MPARLEALVVAIRLLHIRNLPVRRILHQTVDHADSGKTLDRGPALRARALGLRGGAGARPGHDCKTHAAARARKPCPKAGSDTYSRRRHGRDLGRARPESASLCGTRLFSPGSRNLRARRIPLYLRQFRRSLRRSAGISADHAPAARRLDRVARACRNRGPAVETCLLQLHERRAWDRRLRRSLLGQSRTGSVLSLHQE